MYITVCLKWPIDSDLIIVRYLEGRNFAPILRSCMKNIAFWESYRYEFPKMEEELPHEYRKDTNVALYLSEKKDEELIQYINHIPNRSVSYFAKTAFRLCSCNVPIKYISFLIFTEKGSSEKEADTHIQRNSLKA